MKINFDLKTLLFGDYMIRKIMKLTLTTKILLAISFVFLGLIVIVVTGAADFLARGSKVDDRDIVLGCLCVYWLLTCIITALVIAILEKKWKELLLIFLSVSITMIIAELVLGHVAFSSIVMPKHHFVGSKVSHHLIPPNRKLYRGIYEGKVVINKSNEDGLRTEYSRQEFLKYKNRLIILGDSYTFGFGVRQEYTFVKVAEKIIRQRLKRNDIAILNAGMPNYSPLLSGLLFAGKLKSYDPAVVLLFLDDSDFSDDIKYLKEVKQDGDLTYSDVDERDNVKYHGNVYQLFSPLIKYLKYPYVFLFGSNPKQHSCQKFSITINNVVEENMFFIYKYPPETTKPYFLNTLENINRLAAEVKKSGARFILVVAPKYHHWNPNECTDNWDNRYTLNEPYQYEYLQFFDEIKDQLDYKVFNLLPSFQKTKEFPLVFKEDAHWNEKGHNFVANVLADYLIENRYVE